MPARESETRTELQTCPLCGKQHDPGATACLHGKAKIPSHVETQTLSAVTESPVVTEPHGTTLREPNAPLMLKIEGAKLPLPLYDNITLGRPASQGPLWQPHIDLTAFSAHEQGVSRRHIRLTSRDRLTYVADLNSTNGTWLNGQRLTPFTEYLLHDGDMLRLGLLKIGIHF
jgi:FHA domain